MLGSSDPCRAHLLVCIVYRSAAFHDALAREKSRCDLAVETLVCALRLAAANRRMRLHQPRSSLAVRPRPRTQTSNIKRVTITPVKMLHATPTISVTAKPLMGPVPN